MNKNEILGRFNNYYQELLVQSMEHDESDEEFVKFYFSLIHSEYKILEEALRNGELEYLKVSDSKTECMHDENN